MQCLENISKTRSWILPGAGPGDTFGAQRSLDIPPGIYLIRAWNAPVAIQEQPSQFSPTAFTVVESAPALVCLTSGNITVGARGTSDALVWITPIEGER